MVPTSINVIVEITSWTYQNNNNYLQITFVVGSGPATVSDSTPGLIYASDLGFNVLILIITTNNNYNLISNY